ncbi:MAG: hypothetical protein KDB11_33705, partial [Planctomycetales bacterium]|nr:hypothetical protein [Planctomycetales bacterium]
MGDHAGPEIIVKRAHRVNAVVICFDPLVKPLTHKQFDKLARELFSVVLSPHGFSCELSRHCTFTRQIGDDIVHVIMPDPGTRCAWYDIQVFPTSPRFHDDFAERFPDSLGNTLDVWGKL